MACRPGDEVVISGITSPGKRPDNYGLSARAIRILGHGLPPQPRQIRRVVDGQTGKQIADALGISEAGVKKHLKLVFTKLGAANRTEAGAIALRRHLLTSTTV